MTDFSDTERREAYEAARRASKALDDAARALGYEDAHALGTAAIDAEFDRRTDDGVKAITNAHSYLNNGQLEGIHPDTE